MNSKNSKVSFEQIPSRKINELSLSHAAGDSPAQLKASKRQIDTVGILFYAFQTSFFLATKGPKSW